jgi:hypothetical protein
MQRTVWWIAAVAIGTFAAASAWALPPVGGPAPGPIGAAPNVGARAALPLPGAARRETRREDRRFGVDGRFNWYGNRWWYWLPANRWTYYDNGAWQNYTDNDQANYQTNDDRYEFYDGQWWYAMPGGRWDVYADGRWSEYNGNEAPQRRISGYRGLPDEGRREDNGGRPDERAPLNPGNIQPNVPNPGNIQPNVPNPGNVRPNVPNPGNNAVPGGNVP